MKYRICNLGRFLFILWQVKELALVLLKTFMLWHYLSAYAKSKRSFVNILGRKNVTHAYVGLTIVPPILLFHLLADYLDIYLSSLNNILLFLLFDFLFLILFIDFPQWYIITVFFLPCHILSSVLSLIFPIELCCF